MSEIGVYEAKTHLAKLLERVQKGEGFIITRHGRLVAELRPVPTRSREDIVAAIESIKGFAATHRLKGLTPREMINAGRKDASNNKLNTFRYGATMPKWTLRK